MADGPMGIASGRVDERDVSLLTPCPTALGASWDMELVARVGALVGGEAVRRGIDAVLAPNLNLARSPLAGRAFEYFSEDPLLAGVLGAAGSAGCSRPAPRRSPSISSATTARPTATRIERRSSTSGRCAKSTCCPSNCARRPAARGMLAAYNRVNGNYCAEQDHVMTDIVKGEWRFGGAIMSDWFGTHSTVADDRGGLDLEMPGPARFWGRSCVEAADAGCSIRARIADAARRVVATRAHVTDRKADADAGRRRRRC